MTTSPLFTATKEFDQLAMKRILFLEKFGTKEELQETLEAIELGRHLLQSLDNQF